MPMQDPTKSVFDLASLCAAVNILPNTYGRIGEMRLFTPKPISTRTLLIDEQSGTLTLLPSLPVGAPGTPNKRGGRKARSFVVPHIPMQDAVLPETYQGVRAFGSENAASPLATAVNDALASMKLKIDLTREWLRVGALKGIILDGDGSTLYNLYTEFSISQKSVDFVLGTAGTDVAAKCREVLRHIEDNLMGEVMSEVVAEVSAEFYDALVAHASVEAAYANYAAAAERLGGDLRSGFKHGGITFREYRGHAALADAAQTDTRFIAQGEGISFPLGTRNSFIETLSPAPYNETVNTLGLEYYAKSEPREFGKGYKMEVQSNPLPLCLRPAILVRLHTSN